MANIIIDYREQSLIALFTNNKIKFTTKNLDIGDIIISITQNASSVQASTIVVTEQINQITYQIIIERKTISDLVSSIKDGRYKEQKIRLQSAINNFTKIIYIIEGNLSSALQTMYICSDKTSIIGAFISCQLRDKIPIFTTENINETEYLINKIADRLEKKPFEFFNQQNKMEDNYLHHIKLKKKDNMSHKNWWNSVLSLIPGVSITMAEMIINDYPTLQSLCTKYVENDNNTCLSLLENIKVNSEPNARRIGYVISNRIYNYIIGLHDT